MSYIIKFYSPEIGIFFEIKIKYSLHELFAPICYEVNFKCMVVYLSNIIELFEYH